MSQKRNVLEQLKKNELVATLSRFDLMVKDRRSKTLSAQSTVSLRKMGLKESLEVLTFNKIYRALSLDDVALLGAKDGGTTARTAQRSAA